MNLILLLVGALGATTLIIHPVRELILMVRHQRKASTGMLLLVPIEIGVGVLVGYATYSFFRANF